jgi:hypothetical protein
MFVMWEVLFERLKSVQILTISLLELEPMPDARIPSSSFIFSTSYGLETYHSV